ncbi:hypothetical protein MUU72_07625 [Streptomyces sp. RS10V-4]|uniref:hypothetical protein n=1 Tax=Streptomyces rhizoryzae TaxID=2932493 RepID=UPI002005B7F8|nr:hypothetical protein [Streptomyces rhizoryzae]MCK7622967.1 hypothetical protein [Streptomyces rhizoryzae]
MPLIDQSADCDVCTALSRQRDAARRAGCSVTLQSRNAEIANHRQFFLTIEEIAVGAVVYDRDADMVGMVRGTGGVMVQLEHPTQLTWEVPYTRLRPGTEWEVKQLRALAKLQRDRDRDRERERGRCS